MKKLLFALLVVASLGFAARGTPPGVAFSPTSIAFGNQNLGTPTAPQSVTLTNTGTSSLILSSTVATAGPNASDFSISSNTCTNGATITAGATCTFSVSFTPGALGSRTGSWTVSDNAAGSPHTGVLSGTGVANPVVTFVPTSLVFGGSLVGVPTANETVLMTNTGSSNLVLSSNVSLAGANPGDFQIVGSSTCVNGAVVAPAGVCTIIVSFTPTAVGSRSASWSVSDNANGSPHTGTITGTGTSLQPTVISCPPPGCIFQGSGSFTMNGTPAPPTVTIAPISVSVAVNTTQAFTATVMNDPFNEGVNWTLTGPNCSGATCGKLSLLHTASGQATIYTAPPASPGTIVITATSVLSSVSFTAVVPIITAVAPVPAINNVCTPSSQTITTTNTFNCSVTGTSIIVALVSNGVTGNAPTVQACKTSAGPCVSLVQGCPPSGPCLGSAAGAGSIWQFYGLNIGTGFTSIVVTNTVSGNQMAPAIFDASGVGSFDKASQLSSQTTSVGTAPGPSITTAVPGELLICSNASTGATTGVSPPFNFVSFIGFGGAYAINPTASTITPTFAIPNGAWAGFCAAYKLGTTPPVISVTLLPATASVQTSGTKTFIATVNNDSSNAGVTWTKVCSGPCGTLASSSTASGAGNIYTAPASVPGASVSLVQKVKGEISNGATLAIAGTQLGDIICAFANWNTGTGTLAITDTKGQSWPAPIDTGSQSGGAQAYTCFPNTVAGVTGIIPTVSGSAPTDIEFYVREYSGIAGSSPVDQHANSGAVAISPMDSGFMSATTNATDLLIGFGTNGAASSFTAGNNGQGGNYANLDQQTFLGSAVEDFFTTAATNTYKATMTPTVASNGRTYVVALKATGGGGTANVTLTATSVTDPTKSASAVVTITPSAVLGISVSPSSASIVAGSGTVSITGTTNNDTCVTNCVKWTLAGPGTIAPATTNSNAATVYTPPATVSSTTSATITATSVTDGTKSASSTVTVTPVVGPPTNNGSAFSGTFGNAQGGGAATPGGRGGSVINITNTNDSGTGSYRACVQASGPRTCIFRIPGTFTVNGADVTASSPFLTIACQSAPGEVILGGPQNNGALLRVSTHDVIVRGCVFSPDNINHVTGPDGGTTSQWIVNCSQPANSSTTFPYTPGTGCHDIILDHNTTRWSGNKSFITTSNFTPGFPNGGNTCGGKDCGVGPNYSITVQNFLDYEPHEGHPVGYGTATDETCVGTLSGPCLSPLERDIDFHHGLFVTVDHRIPENSNRSSRWINVIVYNYTTYANQWLGAEVIDVIGSKFIKGPQSGSVQPHPIHFTQNSPEMCGTPSVYVAGNIYGNVGDNTVNANQYGDLAIVTNGENVQSETDPNPGGGFCSTAQPGQPSQPVSNTPGIAVPSGWIRSSPMPASNNFPITVDPANTLDNTLLPTVGASMHMDCTGNLVSHRDPQDARVIAQYQNGGGGGFYPNAWSPNNTGVNLPNGTTAQPNWTDTPVTSFPVCVETLGDGIPDLWRTKYGINASANHIDPISGYTELENYLNGIVPNQ